MVRVLISTPIEQYFGTGSKRYVELAGASADTKPTDNVATGSTFTEVDTGKVFFFNEASTSWVEQFTFPG